MTLWDETGCQDDHLILAFLFLTFPPLFYLFIYLLYNIVLVLPYIDTNLPWVYMCSPSWTPLPHLPPHPIPLGHPGAPALSTLSHASNLDRWFISHMIIYMFQCHSPISSRSVHGEWVMVFKIDLTSEFFFLHISLFLLWYYHKYSFILCFEIW